MDGFNEKSTEQVQEQQPLGCLRRFSKTIKVIIIGGLIILLMIPMFMIEDLISERGRTQEEAINEVSEKWSLAQTITGPYLNIQYPVTTENNGEKKISIKDLFLFPDELLVNGQLKTEILKRSIYEVNGYQSELTLKGSFSPEELIKSRVDMEQLQFDKRCRRDRQWPCLPKPHNIPSLYLPNWFQAYSILRACFRYTNHSAW